MLSRKDTDAFVRDYHFHEIECARDKWNIEHAQELLSQFYAFMKGPILTKFEEVKEEYAKQGITLMYNHGEEKGLYFVPFEVDRNGEVFYHIKKVL